MRKILVVVLVTCCAHLNLAAQCNPGFVFFATRGDVRFNANDSSAHLSHKWFYGDGSSATGNSPTAYHYFKPGSYEVKHVVYDSVSHCIDSSIQTIELNYQAECYSYFSIEKFRGPNHLRFNASYSAYGTEVSKISWLIDGEVIALDQSTMEYSFDSPGSHIVSLSVETSSGCTSFYTDTIHAYTLCNLNTSFSHRSTAENARVIKLEATPYNPDYRYWYNVGDERRFVYTYEGIGLVMLESEGNYPISLLITDSVRHCYDSVTKVVEVRGNAYDSCTAGFTATPINNKQYSFQAVSNQTITKQVWTIYNHLTIDSIFSYSGDPVTYNFPDTGSYTVSVLLYTSTSCARVYSESLHVVASQPSPRSSDKASFPNPATNFTTVSVTSAKNTNATISIFNSNGERIFTQKKHLLTGKNDIQLITSYLNKGNYFISIQYDGILVKSRFQKM